MTTPAEPDVRRTTMTPPSAKDHPVLSLFAPGTRRQRVQRYVELRQAGYTDLLVFMVQQILEFERQGKEFAMKYAGAEDEMLEVLEDLFASMPLERRLRCLTIEERLKGLSPEQVLETMSPEDRDRLKELLQQQSRVDDAANPR
jgi:hypothetical protein